MGWGRDIYKLARILVKRPRDGYYLRWYYNGWHYWFFLPGEISLLTDGEDYQTIGTRKVTMASGQVTESQIEALRTIMNTRHIALLTDKGWMSVRIDTGSVVVLKNQISGYELNIVVTVGSRESYYTPIAAVAVIPPDTPDPDTCEIEIGTQVWMCKNYDGNYPGSKVYNDDESNRSDLGGLYTYDMVANPGFAPPGWKVPTEDDMDELMTYIGGLTGAGGVLKEVGFDNWNMPNTGAVDTYGFAALGGGYYGYKIPGGTDYHNIYQLGYFWAINASGHLFYYMRYDTADVGKIQGGVPSPGFANYMSVRLIKDITYAIANAAGLVNINTSGKGYAEIPGFPLCHGSITYGGFIYGSSRNDIFGSPTEGNTIVRVDPNNYANIDVLTVRYLDDTDTTIISDFEQLAQIGKYLYTVGIANYADPLDPFDTGVRNVLVRIDTDDFSYQIYRLTESYSYFPATPILADDTYLYITTPTTVIQYLASDFDDPIYGKHNVDPTYGATGVPVTPVATFTHTAHGTTNKPMHAAYQDATHIYMAFNGAFADNSVLLKIAKAGLTFDSSVAIPVISDDMAGTSTHIFLSVETTAGKTGETWECFGIRKSDLNLTSLKKHSSEPSGYWGYGVFIYEIDSVSYLFSLRQDGRINILDYSAVDTWSALVDCDYASQKILSFDYSDGATHPIINELVLTENDLLHAFLWDVDTELIKFKIGEI